MVNLILYLVALSAKYYATTPKDMGKNVCSVGSRTVKDFQINCYFPNSPKKIFSFKNVHFPSTAKEIFGYRFPRNAKENIK